MDDAIFFASVRSTLLAGSLAQAAVDRLNAILSAFSAYGDGDLQKLAYICATAHRESGAFVYDREIWGPTKQQLGYDGRKDLGNIHPGDGKRFMGRGFTVMITGRKNYTEWGERLGLDLVGNPDLAAQVPYAARIGVEGMMLGTFTGKKLANYIDGNTVLLSKPPKPKVDYVNARRVVNGTDHAEEIAANAAKYEAALKFAGYGSDAFPAVRRSGCLI